MSCVKSEKTGTYTRNNLCFAFFSPLGDFGVDLVSQFWFDFTSVASEEGQESLCPAIDHVYFVKGYGVHDLFAFLDFTFRALDKLGLRTGLAKCKG